MVHMGADWGGRLLRTLLANCETRQQHDPSCIIVLNRVHPHRHGRAARHSVPAECSLSMAVASHVMGRWQFVVRTEGRSVRRPHRPDDVHGQPPAHGRAMYWLSYTAMPLYRCDRMHAGTHLHSRRSTKSRRTGQHHTNTAHHHGTGAQRARCLRPPSRHHPGGPYRVAERDTATLLHTGRGLKLIMATAIMLHVDRAHTRAQPKLKRAQDRTPMLMRSRPNGYSRISDAHRQHSCRFHTGAERGEHVDATSEPSGGA